IMRTQNLKPVRLFDFLLSNPFGPDAPGTSRQMMTVMALAKPYGGNTVEGGYEGAKLIGLASKSIGEIVQNLNLMQVAAPDIGISGAEHIYKEEDFLH